MKNCFKCKILKSLSEFYKHPQMLDGYVNKCKECNKIDVRENYISRKDFYREYKKNRIRFNHDYIFRHRYSGMKARTLGRAGRRYNVENKGISPLSEFLYWCYSPENYLTFLELHTNWVKSNFKNNKTPSIDRIDNSQGYIVDNLQWLTKGDNATKYQQIDKIIEINAIQKYTLYKVNAGTV